jgi:hypothetical protein
MKNKRILTTNIKKPPLLRRTDPGPVDWEKIAKGLWSLLDDISTSYDHYKPTEYSCMKCLHYINVKAQERNKYMYSPDGYDLVPAGANELPNVENLDAMTRWFKDAWNIERQHYYG